MVIGEMVDADQMNQNFVFVVRMSEDGVGGEADYEGIRKLSTLILLLFVQDLGGNRRDG